MHVITQEANRQWNRVYKVEIDFRNTFNAMSQAALWCVMHMLHILDFDLLEQIQASATVSSPKWRRKCKNQIWYRCSTRKHHVPATIYYLHPRRVADAHGNCAESGYQPWFVTWQGPGKKQSRRQPRLSFNNIGFIDDIFIFAQTPEGTQTLPDVMQEFTTWCGTEDQH